jgi:hypothetical protein
MASITFNKPSRAAMAVRIGLWAGLAGGAAEVLWIALFSQITGGSAAFVADSVTATVVPSLAGSSVSVTLGLAIHFGLAALLGIAVAVGIRSILPQLARTWAETALVIGTLAVVWMVNFLIVLPAINPAFVHIVPMPVSLASKLLFGVATVLVLRMQGDKA